MIPIKLYFKSAKKNAAGVVSDRPILIDTFTSYNFDRNILVPAAAFRFTAPGVDKALRQSIRSGDLVAIFGVKEDGTEIQLGTGFIDETDTHVQPTKITYVLTGRDTLGAFVDNDSVDSQNKIVNTTQTTLPNILKILLQNTRIPQTFISQQVPNGSFLFQTNPGGETKATAMQRYLEFTNCLMWTAPSGQIILGKPNFAQKSSGQLILNSSDNNNNCLEARARRNINQAIRQIVTQLQGTEQVDPVAQTIQNSMQDIKDSPGVGKSLFRLFSYGSGNDVVNKLSGTEVGGSPWDIGNQLSQREIAKENMKILDVEIVVKGHINNNGELFNVDQIYDVQIEDDGVNEPMYVYSCAYELTIEHGMLTRLKLCKTNTIIATSASVASGTV